MRGMGLCCQRAVEDKENLTYRWPNGSHPPVRHDSDSSVPYSPRGSFNETLCEIPDEDEEDEDSEGSLKSPRTPGPQTSSVSNHLQVISILGNRKNSRTSTSSGRSSVASVMSIQSATQLARMSSLGRPEDYDNETSSISAEIKRKRKPRRAVSLKLPSRYRKSQESETKLPTIYVDDPPCRPAAEVRRKSSLQMALSLLSLTNNAPAEPKPVQKILRQPTRRHHVRGVSGLSVAAENTHQASRRQTLYYPPSNVPVRTRRTSTSGFT